MRIMKIGSINHYRQDGDMQVMWVCGNIFIVQKKLIQNKFFWIKYNRISENGSYACARREI